MNIRIGAMVLSMITEAAKKIPGKYPGLSEVSCIDWSPAVIILSE